MIMTNKPKLILPKNKETKKPNIPMTSKEREAYYKMLPDPVGYRILIRPHVPSNKTEGGVYLSDKTQETMEVTTVVGLVIKMGPLCYQDTDKFPSGPWCKEKDWVMFARYAGSRIKIDGGEMRLLNDDEVLATIDSPEDILHEF